ncbi:MAG: mycofactocin-coupled SDR family oxidoreductase [Solirubrobacterales bacterium]
MSERLQDKVALITGGARGIGRACAVRFAEEGADVALVDVARDIATVPYGGASERQLHETAHEVQALGHQALTFVADVRDAGGMAEAVEATIAKWGRIDVLVAAAGLESHGRTWELSREEWDTVVDVNLTGVWQTASAVIPHMLSRRSGSLVIVGSENSHRPTAGYGHYAAAKHGVLGLTRALALELGPSTIRVNMVAPTATATDLLLSQLHRFAGREDATEVQALRRLSDAHAIPLAMVQPLDVANAALFLASEEARYVTGISLPVDLGALLK